MAAIAVATASRQSRDHYPSGNKLDSNKLRDDSKARGGTEDNGPSRRESVKNNLEMLHQLSTAEIQALKDKLAPQPMIPFNVQIALLWLTWLLGGALVYTWINQDWSYAQSFYYACNVGYSIGYGAIYEYNELSLVWSIIMIFLGSGVIGGAIGYFASATLESAGDFKPGEDDDDTEEGGKGAGWVTRTWKAIQTYYDANQVRVNVFSLLVLWIVMGTMFGVLHQKWSVLRSMYFAISGMSTAGLQAPETVGEGQGKYIPTDTSIFLGFFSATGVPIFGLALAQLGGVFVDAHIERKEREIMARLITKEEFESVANLDDAGDDDMVGFTEFALLELMRLGKTNMEEMAHIRHEFDVRDLDNSGAISWQEIRAFQVSRAARVLEAERLVREEKVTKKEARALVEDIPLDELKVLSDMAAFKDQTKASGVKVRRAVKKTLLASMFTRGATTKRSAVPTNTAVPPGIDSPNRNATIRSSQNEVNAKGERIGGAYANSLRETSQELSGRSRGSSEEDKKPGDLV